MRNVCKFAALIIARYFKNLMSYYKMIKDFSELKIIRSRLEVRPMHAQISISRGEHIGILLRNLGTMKEWTALQDKDLGQGLSKYTSEC